MSCDAKLVSVFVMCPYCKEEYKIEPEEYFGGSFFCHNAACTRIINHMR